MLLCYWITSSGNSKNNRQRQDSMLATLPKSSLGKVRGHQRYWYRLLRSWQASRKTIWFTFWRKSPQTGDSYRLQINQLHNSNTNQQHKTSTVLEREIVQHVVAALHFKMKSIDWTVELNPKDVLLRGSHPPQTSEIIKSQMWQFKTLPLGLNGTPHTFTKPLRPVGATLRRLGILILLWGTRRKGGKS